MKLHCILPCKAQADGWTSSERDVYRSMMDEADSIVYVNREKTRDCMLERNRYMIDYASLVLAVYNGEKRGGTAATIRCDHPLCPETRQGHMDSASDHVTDCS